MASFDNCIEFILKHEGGLSNNQSDPGGLTNYGISIRFLIQAGIDVDGNGKINDDDVFAINETDAKVIYKKYWWDKYRYAEINSDRIAEKVMDMAINMGPTRAHRLIQIAVNRLNEKPITVDGIIGTETLNAINNFHNELILLAEMRECAAHFYRNLVADNPNLSVFLLGFLNRAYD